MENKKKANFSFTWQFFFLLLFSIWSAPIISLTQIGFMEVENMNRTVRRVPNFDF